MEQLRSAAADVVGSNDDLLRLILLRLPVKSLLKFKLVSKRWRSIIFEDREFAIEHSRINSDSNAPCGIFLYAQYQETPMSIPIFGGSVPSLSFLNGIGFPKMSFTKIQSCNGLLLFHFREYEKSLLLFNLGMVSCYIQQKIGVIVCNPTTRDFKLLPPIPAPPTVGDDNNRIFPVYDGCTLVFNPSKSHHYKVAVIRSFESQNEEPMHSAGLKSELHIYSSETNSWEFKRHFDVDMADADPGVYQNDDDKIYWLKDYLVSYDLNSEDFGYTGIRRGEFLLTQSRGRIFLAGSFEYDGDWRRSLIFDFKSKTMQWLNPPVYNRTFYPIAIVKREHKTGFLAPPNTDNMLIFTDTLRNRSFEVHVLWSHKFSDVCEYIPSLAPV